MSKFLLQFNFWNPWFLVSILQLTMFHFTWSQCASIPTLTCGEAVTASTTGTGVWSPGSCGFTTPGHERIYTFTPNVTGMHTLVITAASGGFGDYFYKLASVGCNSTGWICIGDATGPESNSFGPLTAGMTYYILFDSEVTAAASQTFRLDCPPD
ncbi:MAG: hypothetical protein IPI60_00135 [Saprospiraceae bacterium]|nr:hypothetical protein [Saprospiraceae bacterium]